MPEIIDIETARRLLLLQQGLLQASPRWGKGKTGALKAISALGYAQLDAIAVVERAHHHTLWSRIPGYRPEQLYALLEQQQLFEYWSHAVAFMPMANYRFYLHRMERLRQRGRHWYRVELKIKRWVIDKLRDQGPLFARDFASHGHVSKGMWDGKPARQALHELFMAGDVMVKARSNFQRQYDLAERIVDPQAALNPPDQQALGRFVIESAVGAQGLIRKAEMVYLQQDLREAVDKALPDMLESGQLLACRIAGLTGQDYFTTPALLNRKLQIKVPQLHLLSPFDNAIIQRKRLQTLFGFGYQTEIYVPPAKRRYGYFALPILWGDSFIGRIDPKAERASGNLLVRNLVLEPQVKITAALLEALAKRLKEFARFNSCHQVVLEQVSPPGLKARLSSALATGADLAD